MYEYTADFYIDNNVEVSRFEALHEVKEHGIELEEFYAEFGDQETYNGGAILSWLGY